MLISSISCMRIIYIIVKISYYTLNSHYLMSLTLIAYCTRIVLMNTVHLHRHTSNNYNILFGIMHSLRTTKKKIALIVN